MADLSHWDFADQFKAKEAAELFLGIPPEANTQLFGVMGDEAAHTAKITPVIRRMKDAYDRAFNTLNAAMGWGEGGFEDFPKNPKELESELMSEIRVHKFFEISARQALEIRIFEKAYFSRAELCRWLDAIGMPSTYQFSPRRRPDATIRNLEPIPTVTTELDPLDLPPELDAANMAFRAVSNGYGEQSATPRNRLIDYLEKTFKGLGSEAVQRIATVANPDKTTGRKKRDKE